MLTIQSDLKEFRRLRFSCDSQFLAVTDGTTRNGEGGYEIWHIPTTGRPAYQASTKAALGGMEWHPSKAELYVPNELVLDIVAPDGNLLQSLSKVGWVEGIVFSPSGEWLVVYSPFQLLAFQRNNDQWREVWAVENSIDFTDRFESVAVFPNGGSLVVLVGRRVETPRIDWTHFFAQRNLQSGKVLAERLLSAKERPLGVRNRLAVTPDGLAVLGFRGRSVHVWPTDATQPARKFTVAKKDVWDFALHPSGRWVVTVCNNAEASVWELATGKAANVFDWGIGPLRCVAISPDGSLAAVGNEKGKIAIWDWEF